jgi:hypothetical protein
MTQSQITINFPWANSIIVLSFLRNNPLHVIRNHDNFNSIDYVTRLDPNNKGKLLKCQIFKDQSLARHTKIELNKRQFIGLPLKFKETFFLPSSCTNLNDKKNLLAIFRFLPNVKFHR